MDDAIYYNLVSGLHLPPAKFSIIDEHVWLLEKTQAKHKFLVFGNDIEMPTRWLAKYGHLRGDVVFYFLTPDAHPEELTCGGKAAHNDSCAKCLGLKMACKRVIMGS